MRRAEPPHVLTLPDFDRVCASPTGGTRTFGELLIDCEEDRTFGRCLSGMLRGSRPGRRAIAEEGPDSGIGASSRGGQATG